MSEVEQEKHVVGQKKQFDDTTVMAMKFIVLGCIIYLFYYAYQCFQTNQSINEGFIEKTIKTGTESDLSFDVGAEIKKLNELHERLLSQLGKS